MTNPVTLTPAEVVAVSEAALDRIERRREDRRVAELKRRNDDLHAYVRTVEQRNTRLENERTEHLRQIRLLRRERRLRKAADQRFENLNDSALHLIEKLGGDFEDLICIVDDCDEPREYSWTHGRSDLCPDHETAKARAEEPLWPTDGEVA